VFIEAHDGKNLQWSLHWWRGSKLAPLQLHTQWSLDSVLLRIPSVCNWDAKPKFDAWHCCVTVFVCVVKMYNMWALLTLCWMTLSYYMDNLSWMKTILRFRAIVMYLLPLYKKHHTCIHPVWFIAQSSPLLPWHSWAKLEPLWRFITLQMFKCWKRGWRMMKEGPQKSVTLHISLLNRGLISFRKYSLNEEKRTHGKNNILMFLFLNLLFHI
jgi:hypothetical protein